MFFLHNPSRFSYLGREGRYFLNVVVGADEEAPGMDPKSTKPCLVAFGYGLSHYSLRDPSI
jgi:hypothetical protein